jgi:SAM-dependent methyltransferase
MKKRVDEDRKYWNDRSRDFDKLEWASRQDYLSAMVRAGDPRSDDFVLDAGTGTGIVARAIAPLVDGVIGVDLSPEMIEASMATEIVGCQFEVGNCMDLRFPTGHFSKVYSRMMFHSLIDGGDIAASECHRVLKEGGKFILSEGIPPSSTAEPWYTEMFRLKEERLTFSQEILEDLLLRNGFVDIHTQIHISPQVSIANWLENGDLSSEQCEQIMQVHLEMPDEVKKAYHATFDSSGDVLSDMKFVIVVGTKPESGNST